MDVSFIIPIYKGQRYISRLIDMISQAVEYQNSTKECLVELILVNDYPNEDLEVFHEDYSFSIKVVNHDDNRGIHASRIDGIQESSGKYICMLDQDDYIKKDWLLKMYSFIEMNGSDAVVCYGMLDRFTPMYGDRLKEYVNDLAFYIGQGNAIVSPGQVLIKRTVFPLRWFDPVLKNNGADDYYLWILFLKQGYKFGIVDEYLFMHSPERTDDSIDDAKMNTSLREVFDLLKSDFLNDDEKKLMLDRICRLESQGENTNPSRKKRIMDLMTLWKQVELGHGSIASFLKMNGIKRVGIYGLGEVGIKLVEELAESGVIVKFAADRREKIDFFEKIPIISGDINADAVDFVIVTPTKISQDDIDGISDQFSAPVMTLRDILLRMDVDIKIL